MKTLITVLIIFILSNLLYSQNNQQKLTFTNQKYFVEKSFEPGSKIIIWTSGFKHSGKYEIHSDSSLIINNRIIYLKDITHIDKAYIRNRYFGPTLLSIGTIGAITLTRLSSKYSGPGYYAPNFNGLYLLAGAAGFVIVDIVGTVNVINNRKVKINNDKKLTIK